MENTPRHKASQDPPIEKNERLRGVPAGLLCRACDIMDELKISDHTWRLWKARSLKTYKVGTNAELVLTSELLEFIAGQDDAAGRSHKKRVRKK
jgi:hypothetical protein